MAVQATQRSAESVAPAWSDRPLHVLVLADRDWRHPQGGGSGEVLRQQVERWVAWGHRVSIIACGFRGGARLERDGALTIHRVGGRSTVFPQAIVRQAAGLVPAPDVALEVINGITFLTPAWLRTPAVSLVHHVHREHYVAELGIVGRVAGFGLETLPLATLYRRRRFICVSEASAREVAAHGIPRHQIVVNHNGIDADLYGPAPRTADPTIVFLGRLKRYKRIPLIFDALEALPELRMEIAGDGDYRTELEREASARGLGDRVRFHGFVDRSTRRYLLGSCWANVTASLAEGWCLTVLEAAACGTPSVAIDVGGLSESIVDGQTGVLATDGRDLPRAIASVVRDPVRRDALGAAALGRARTFNWDATAAVTLNELQAAADPAASLSACVHPQ